MGGSTENRSLRLTGLIIWVLIVTPLAVADSIEGPFTLGVVSCTWDQENPYGYSYQPYMTRGQDCQGFATGQGFAYTGEGDDTSTAAHAAHEVPATACTCGDKTETWFFDTAAAPGRQCRGFVYSCTRPGTGCKWGRTGASTSRIDSTEACRSKASECGGVYYGLNTKAAAFRVPEGSCVCGESKVQWYSESDGSLVCGSFTYTCVGPPRPINGR
jgi:hypothetical protein